MFDVLGREALCPYEMGLDVTSEVSSISFQQCTGRYEVFIAMLKRPESKLRYVGS